MSGCLDLGIAKPNQYNEVAKMLAEEEIEFVVLMEDRQPDFFLNYDRFDRELFVRLNRHGPYNGNHYYPTQGDLKLFVDGLHDSNIKVLYGAWIHENRWIIRRHPEILLTDREGHLLHTNNLSVDFNPLAELKSDHDYGIRNGDKFVEYMYKQYSKLADDFGFDGLFIGDGGMGFRMFGDDNIGVNCYDYSKSSITKFLDSEFFSTNGNHNQKNECILNRKEIKEYLASEEEKIAQSNFSNNNTISEDIWLYHKDEWTEWNCLEWSNFYRTLAHNLHFYRNEKLGAFSCMNYGPEKAIRHGVDYRTIATSGLDYLIFQTYDYAWGKHFRLEAKDIAANAQELLSLHSHLSSWSSRQKIKILFTAETGDSIENWYCPASLTLEEISKYILAKSKDDEHHFSMNEKLVDSGMQNFVSGPVADGVFIVWINETAASLISDIRNTLRTALNDS